MSRTSTAMQEKKKFRTFLHIQLIDTSLTCVCVLLLTAFLHVFVSNDILHLVHATICES